MTDEEADLIVRALGRALRPTLRPGVDALVSNGRTMDQLAGAMALREQQGEAREQRIADTVTRLEARLDAVAPKPAPKPRTDTARDELGGESLTLLSSIVRGLRLAPGRLLGVLTDALAYMRANPGKATLMAGGAVTVLRILAGWIPGLAPLADALEALMARYSPGAEAPS
jgi:hypothetical protein